MNIFFYIIIFIMGTIFGSFLSLATYRIPLNQDITHKHSYCPHCTHKLSFLDLIPIFSYLFLRGKCRYCKKKISPRYFILEIFTGLSFILLSLGLNINIYTIQITQIINFVIGVLYIVFLYLVAGIDIMYKKIDKRVLIYGIIIALLNITCQYIECLQTNINYNLNRIIIYLVAIVLLNMINIIKTKKNKKTDYITDIIILSIIMSLFTYEITVVLTIICTLLTIALKIMLTKITNKDKNNIKKCIERLPIAFFMVIANVIIVVFSFIYSM